jgi:hypothetical protein
VCKSSAQNLLLLFFFVVLAKWTIAWKHYPVFFLAEDVALKLPVRRKSFILIMVLFATTRAGDASWCTSKWHYGQQLAGYSCVQPFWSQSHAAPAKVSQSVICRALLLTA